MKNGSSEPLTLEQKAELDALAASPEDRIDTIEMPEVRDWTGARRGALYRPIKRQLTLRLDADLVEWFKQSAGERSDGYQTRINAALREYVEQHEGLRQLNSD
jgi:uncharacterized protein (DUF4415 family)